MSLTKMGEVRFETLHLLIEEHLLNVEVGTLMDSLTVKTKTQKWYVTQGRRSWVGREGTCPPTFLLDL